MMLGLAYQTDPFLQLFPADKAAKFFPNARKCWISHAYYADHDGEHLQKDQKRTKTQVYSNSKNQRILNEQMSRTYLPDITHRCSLPSCVFV